MNNNFLRILAWSAVLFVIIRFFLFPSISNTNENKLNDVSGYKFKAPSSQLEMLPAQREFLSEQPSEEKKYLENKLCKIGFDSANATIATLDFLSYKDHSELPIRTLNQTISPEWIGGMHLSFDDQNNPKFVLDSINKKENSISFVSNFNGWKINKTFSLNDFDYSINLTLDFEKIDSNAQELNLRLALPSPYSSSVKNNNVFGFSNNTNLANLEIIKGADEQEYIWKKPYIFGSADKYFVNSFLGSKETFDLVKRSYFDRRSHGSLVSIFELWPVQSSEKKVFKFYMGPKYVPEMDKANKDLDQILSFGMLSPICKLLLLLMEFLRNFVSNFGLIIILMAILLKLPFVPLFIFAKKKVAFHEQFEKDHAFEIADISRKFRNSISAKALHLSRLYEKYGVSQYGKFILLVPVLFQLPIIFSLYKVLQGYILLYNAPFTLWIQDLSSADPYFILPLILGAATFLQQQINSTNQVSENDVTNKLKYVMPAILFFVFSKLPSGLVLYWIMNSLLTITEELIFRAFKK